MTADRTPAPDGDLSFPALRHLDTHGYFVLPNAIPADWLAPLRAAFDTGVLPSDQWPVPRQSEWRHAQVDLDAHVQRACRLPALLAAVHHVLRTPVFLSQVEGREPLQGNAPQPLHRDAAGCSGQLMAAMVWLDDYGPANGATQVVPGSHRIAEPTAALPQILSGDAGDILIFDPDLLHGATSNVGGARRRSLLLSYACAALRPDHLATEAIRGVRMDTTEIFGADAAPVAHPVH
ncbi:MAG: phytanoyl-CoA dioxygenase family protein [Sphingomonas sp.]|uniref:phytanoyl-CoA dioxygenase family protein n=1 Tax=Sphingomonas sp. TaxID=28214 RepID=UPI0025CC9B0B|nr:phytanoyl-CoA dioxygenase family protein [Sphingomonas sp.]MBY0284648.1 phytanoyl-CoA dioxygenase family protein [Sphingomonas sp.]